MPVSLSMHSASLAWPSGARLTEEKEEEVQNGVLLFLDSIAT